MREQAECSRQSVDAPKGFKDIDKGDDQKAFAVKDKSPTSSWYSRAGRLSRTLSRQFISDDELYGEVAAEKSQRRGGSLLGRGAVLAAAVTLLLAGISGAMLFRTSTPAQNSARGPGVAKYLHDIAAWHESSKTEQSMPAFLYLEASMKACAKQVQLPGVQLPKQLPGVTWKPSSSYSPDPLDELGLNCSSPDDAEACALAASSNAYEGELPALDPGELAAYLAPIAAESKGPAAAQAIDPTEELATLDMDCEADPAACAAVSGLTNEYSDVEDATGSGFDPATEAAAYLQAAYVSSGWDAVIGQQPARAVQQSGTAAAAATIAPNSYEGQEQLWEQRRITEEAGSQYMDASMLDLECSAAGAGEDAEDNAQECERTRAVNRYEATAATSQETTAQAAGPKVQFDYGQYGFRTVGYDVAAVDWMEFGAAAGVPSNSEAGPAAHHHRDEGCGCKHHHEQQQQHAPPRHHHHHHHQQQQQRKTDEAELLAGMPPSKLQQLQQQLQDVIRQRRVTGYDVPAVDEEAQFAFAGQQQAASTAAPAATATVGVVAVDGSSSVQQDDLQRARLYYKNPCNSPDVHQQYKNQMNHPMHHIYYKNPANMPVYLHEQQAPKEQVTAAPGPNNGGFLTSDVKSFLMSVLGLLVAFAASAVGTWYLMSYGYGSRPCYVEQKDNSIQEEDEEREEVAEMPVMEPYQSASAAAALPLPSLIAVPSMAIEENIIAEAAAAAAGLPASHFGCSSSVAVKGPEHRLSLLDDVPLKTESDSPRYDSRVSTPVPPK